jgi:hypothetical protein
MQWRAEARPTPDAEPIEAWADSSHAAALAVLARWLSCEADLADALGKGGTACCHCFGGSS